MIITYIRSSSLKNWSFCQLQYYITYVLGHLQKSNQKADKGTISHKALEVLACCTQAIQEGKDEYEDEALGKFKFNYDSLYKPTELDVATIDAINRTRRNKKVYKRPHNKPGPYPKLEYGHVRYGYDMVEDIIERAYAYYSKKYSHHTWAKVDKKDINNWVWMALEYRDGLYDPRNRKIIDAEPHFDIEIDKPWARYEYDTPDGKMSGNLSIKGTIDLVTDAGDGIIEIVDWKTGQRLDWIHGGEKTYKKLCNDPQLMLYYYAASHLYPDAKHIMLSIFFVRDGGPFTICFDKEHIDKMEEKLFNTFKEIQKCDNPKMLDPKQEHWKCQYICDYYKTNWPGTKINKCRYIKQHLNKHGMDKTTEECMNPDHDVDNYEDPGE